MRSLFVDEDNEYELKVGCRLTHLVNSSGDILGTGFATVALFWGDE